MKSRVIKVSVLYGTGSPNPKYREVLSELNRVKLFKEAQDPETFLTQHQDKPPDLVLVDLNGTSTIPDWLKTVIERLPKTEVMVCSPSRDPDFLIRVMKLRAGGFIPLPLKREEVLATVERVRAERQKHQEPGRHQILAVTGTKGGVGVTSIATNLAVALAEIMPGGVTLIDLARPFPHVGQFLDLKSDHTIKDLVESADNLDPMFVKKIVMQHKSNLDVLLTNSDYRLQSSLVPDSRIMGNIFTALRSMYDWVVVDLGNWMDLFCFQVLQEADQILLVTELTLPNLQNLKIIKNLFQEWGLDGDKTKLVVNHYTKHYALGLKEVERIFLQRVFSTFPHEYHPLMEAINQGEPLGDLGPRSKLWRKLKELAAELVKEAAPETGKHPGARSGLLRRIFS